MVLPSRFWIDRATWLAEGLAEMGQYWKLDKKAVDINPRVITYLKGTRPKRKLLDIAVPGRTDPGSWQDYAWRWALCHLLANNPNADRQTTAIALMKQQNGASLNQSKDPQDRNWYEYAHFSNNSTMVIALTQCGSGTGNQPAGRQTSNSRRLCRQLAVFRNWAEPGVSTIWPLSDGGTSHKTGSLTMQMTNWAWKTDRGDFQQLRTFQNLPDWQAVKLSHQPEVNCSSLSG